MAVSMVAAGGGVVSGQSPLSGLFVVDISAATIKRFIFIYVQQNEQ